MTYRVTAYYRLKRDSVTALVITQTAADARTLLAEFVTPVFGPSESVTAEPLTSGQI